MKHQIEVLITVECDDPQDAVDHLIGELDYLITCENRIVGFRHPEYPRDVYYVLEDCE